MKPIDPHAGQPRVHPSELLEDSKGNPIVPEAERSTFLVRPLTTREWSYIQNVSSTLGGAISEDGDMGGSRLTVQAGTSNLWRLRFGLRGVENFEGWEDEEHPLDKALPKIPTVAFLDTIPSAVRDWILSEIDDLATLTVDEGKKSSPPSTSSARKRTRRNAARSAATKKTG